MDILIPIASTFANTSHNELSTHDKLNAFQDTHGRFINLRGINVGACGKYPMSAPLAGTSEFFKSESITYTGRPFSTIQEAREWWRKLATWGVNVVRFVIVWEALEPVSRGTYDDQYIDYVVQVLEEADKAGLKVFIDCHQDVWSRFCGGSGAPLWTFQLAGLNPKNFRNTLAAALEPPPGQKSNDEEMKYANPSARLWPTNYSKLACNTMFTLFFGGEVWCPNTLTPEGENVGRIIRSAYCNAYGYLAKRLFHISAVMGFDLMNEPYPGFIGLKDLEAFDQNTNLHLGPMPNALQTMALAGSGMLKVPYYTRSWPGPSRHSHDISANPKKLSAWEKDFADIWHELGLYIYDATRETVRYGPNGRKDYFCRNPKTGALVDFEADHYVPFIRQFQDTLRKNQNGRLGWTFVEPVPNLGPPNLTTHTSDKSEKSNTNVVQILRDDDKICYAPHWYDLRVLFEKALWYPVSFNVSALAKGSRNMWRHTHFGSKGLTNNYTAQFDIRVAQLTKFRHGKKTPLLIGETGVPFDMNDLDGYKTGNIHNQLTMLDAITSAMERHLMNWTLWTFTLVNNTNRDGTSGNVSAVGDGWNTEDFSLVSNDPATTEIPIKSPETSSKILNPHNNGKILQRARLFSDLYKGCRLPAAWVRPYAAKIAGLPLLSNFDLKNIAYSLVYGPNSVSLEIARTTEIFLPLYHYGQRDIRVRVGVFPLGKAHFEPLQEEIVLGHLNRPTKVFLANGALVLSHYPDLQSVTVIHTEKCFEGGIMLNFEAWVDEETAPRLPWTFDRVLQAIISSFV